MKDDCVFCKIISGLLPSLKVYEEDEYFAFLDIKPLNPGHTLVVPKKHYRFVDEITDFGGYFEVAKKIGKAIGKATGYKHIYYITLGNMINHAHIIVFPHFDGDGHGDDIDFNAHKDISESEMKKLASDIRKEVL